jgi:hypothetical protein
MIGVSTASNIIMSSWKDLFSIGHSAGIEKKMLPALACLEPLAGQAWHVAWKDFQKVFHKQKAQN